MTTYFHLIIRPESWNIMDRTRKFIGENAMWKALKRISFTNLLGGLLLAAVGIGLLIVFINFSYKDFSIWFFGKEVIGTVEKTYYVQTGEDAGVRTYQYYIDYVFTTEDGETYQGTTELSINEYGLFREGGDVKVLYSPLSPTNNRVDDSRFVPVLFCSYIPVFLIILLTLVSGWRLITGEIIKPEPAPWLKDLSIKRE